MTEKPVTAQQLAKELAPLLNYHFLVVQRIVGTTGMDAKEVDAFAGKVVDMINSVSDDGKAAPSDQGIAELVRKVADLAKEDESMRVLMTSFTLATIFSVILAEKAE